MQIGVISDTHLIDADEALCQVAQETFRSAELILHAGDLTRIGVLDAFSGKTCVAVRGNMDRGESARRLPRKQVVTVQGIRIGLIHGWGAPFGIADRVLREFSDVHAVVYGHSHKPDRRWKNGVLLFNPGAFSGTLLLKRNRSVGILSVGDRLSAEHVSLG
jgi:putative phosphoesterase